MGDLLGPQWAEILKRLMEYIKIKGPEIRRPGLGDSEINQSNPGFTGEGKRGPKPPKE